MDATTGVLITAVGVDCLRHVRRRQDLALASLPVLFGVHQLVETLVWLGLRGQVPQATEDLAAWVYLLIAMVVVPIAVPYAFLRVRASRLPRLGVVFVACGVAAAAADALALGVGVVPHEVQGHQITYHPGADHSAIWLSLYVVACCGPALAARSRPLQLFGVLNLVVVSVLAALNRQGVISLWCVWAAITSVLIDLHLRRSWPVGRPVGSSSLDTLSL
jgi:hypothetical protein